MARRLDLVYGGGSIGLMGLVSQAVHHAGGNVLGYTQTHKTNQFLGFANVFCFLVYHVFPLLIL